MHKHRLRRGGHPLAVLLLSTALLACGGGGGDDSTPSPGNGNVGTPDSGDYAIIGNTSVLAGEAVAFYGRPPSGSSLDWRYQWRQTAGPSLDIANPTSPLAAFTVPGTGSYQLELTVSNEQGSVVGTFDFNANSAGSGLRVLRDHEVAQGNRVSLRAENLYDVVGGEAQTRLSNLQWSLLEGPTINDWVNEDPLIVTFTAPQVGEDTLMRFELSAEVDGQAVTDEAWVLVTPTPAPVNDAYFEQPVARVQAYRPDSPWADALERCVYSTQFNSPCSVDSLPLIGQTNPNPTIDQVMDRVVVSHPWMGDQFRAFLEHPDQAHGDFLALLSSVSAVVLSYDVRPSFYWVVSGAIYLDPENLWQYAWQRDTINEDPDYRSGFGSALQFLMPWRYVKDNDYASLFYPVEFHLDRDWSQINPDLASLLYHELAHANDYFPRSTHNDITRDSLLDEWWARTRAGGLPSDDLTNGYPLASEEMFGLAQVSFQGETATTAQRNYTPDDVASYFFPDRAGDYYNYSSPREDLAMLFEEAMMQHRYGIFRDVAVSSQRSTDPAEDLIISQGQRGRIGENALAPRLEMILDDIMPELSGLSSQLATPQPMVRGLNWWDNLVLQGTVLPAAVPQMSRPDALAQPLGLPGRNHFEPRHSGHRH
ncbi:PKD domain-containing protein [Ferrimonas marina]|uniref:PKD domain-containing protein n=1 Tax=Ferrimonas marina TaxID=299255 RepID=A0A1M5RG33_9GAMM|nr:PKD domain-containing protein [Ferrimonas marina]SHH25221.1 hypothetical protein SAMN02745129_1609 [Ferrimonas marina]